MDTVSKPRAWKVLLAFAIIYFVWGSTFLAIRVGVREVPPFLLAGMRFLVAGGLLYGWMRARGTPSPSAREWGAASFLAVLIFVFDYGLLFWAERRVPSGIAAVMMATIPVFMAIGEIVFLRTQRLTWRLGIALLLGMTGVAVLVGRFPFGHLLGNSTILNSTISDSTILDSTIQSEPPVDAAGACVLIFAAISWSVAASLSRRLPSPAAKAMSSGTQMLAGGVMLMITAALLGEFRGFQVQAVSREAWLALAYLIVAGSIVGFTAYVWLIHHESPTKVGTYAYVNPVVAVLVGYFLGGEGLGARTVVGTLLVLVSVVVITTTPKPDSGSRVDHLSPARKAS
jgi:drug/metabolite transporter (DMT)-like permease